MFPAFVVFQRPVGISVISPPNVAMSPGGVMVPIAVTPETYVTGFVGAIVAAVVGELDDAPQMNRVADRTVPQVVGGGIERSQILALQAQEGQHLRHRRQARRVLRIAPGGKSGCKIRTHATRIPERAVRRQTRAPTDRASV